MTGAQFLRFVCHECALRAIQPGQAVLLLQYFQLLRALTTEVTCFLP